MVSGSGATFPSGDGYYKSVTIQSGASLSNSGTQSIGYTGDFTIESGGTLTFAGSGSQISNFNILTTDSDLASGTFTNAGTLNLGSGANSLIQTHDAVLASGSTTTINGSGGTTASTGSGSFVNAAYLFAGFGTEPGTLLVEEGATVDIKDYGYMGIATNSTMLINGQVSITASASGSFAGLRGTDVYSSSSSKWLEGQNASIVLGETGVINVQSGSGTAAIFAPEVSIEGGIINVASGATFTFAGDVANANNDSGDAIMSGAATHVTMNSGTLNIADGGTLVIAKGTANVDNPYTPDVDESEIAQGTLTINGGTLSGTGTLDVKGKLETNSSILSSFVQGSGSVVLDSGSFLEFTNDADLAGFKYSGGTTGSDGLISVSGGTITGDSLTISSALKDSGNSVFSGSVHVVADNLTLGTDTEHTSGSLGFTDATAKNLILKDESSLELANALTLVSTRDAELDGTPIAENGTITGNLTIGTASASGSLTIDGGAYTANGDITLSSGSLTVQNSNKASESSLTLTGDLVVTGANTFAVNVSGDNATLDITSAYLRGEGSGASGTTFSVSGGGTLNILGSQVQSILDAAATGSNVPLSKVVLSVQSGGTLDIDGDVTYNLNSTNVQAVQAVIKPESGSTMLADNVTVNVDWGDTTPEGHKNAWSIAGTAYLDTLTLNATNNSNSVDQGYIEHGTYNLASALSSNLKVLELSSDEANAIINFGYIEDVDTNGDGTTDYSVGQAGGSINVATFRVGLSGAAFVQSGVWNAQNISLLSGGSMTVGALANNEAYKTFEGEDITATLNGQGLSVASDAGSFSVTRVGSATFETLDAQKASGVSVAGTLTINGDDNPAEGAATNDIKSVAGGIAISSTGTLNIGNAALDSVLTLTDDSVTFDADIAEGAISAAANGTVRLDFASGSSLTASQLSAIKKHLFSDADSNGNIQGILNIGQAQIGGLNIVTEEDGTKTITCDDLSPVADTNSDVTNDELEVAVVTGVDSGFKSHVGAVQSTTNSVSVVGNSSFNNAADNNGLFASTATGEAANVSVTNGSDLSLNNGGTIGAVSLNGGSADDPSVLTVGGDTAATTVITSVEGNDHSTFDVAANTQVKGTVRVGNVEASQNLSVGGALTVRDSLVTTAGSKVAAESLSVANDATVLGDLQVTGNAEFTGSDTYLGGNNSFSTVTFHDYVELDHGTTSAETVTLRADTSTNTAQLDVIGNAVLDAGVIQGYNNAAVNIYVGENAGSNELTGETWTDSTGYLMADRIDLNGGVIQADPDYNLPVSIVTTAGFGNSTATIDTDDAGILDGKAIALRNAILAIGVQSSEDKTAVAQMQELFAQYIDSADGSLSRDEVGSIIYVAKSLDMTNGSKLITHSSMSHDSYAQALNSNADAYDSALASVIANNDVYLGANTALAISDVASKEGKTAITFDKDAASIYGAGGKIVLTGNFSSRDTISLFADKGTTGTTGVTVAAGSSTINVETINGLLTNAFSAGEDIGSFNLHLNRERVNTIYTDVSAPVKNTLITYAAGDHNWATRDANDVEPLVGDYRADISYVDGKYVYSDDSTPVSDSSNLTYVTNADGSIEVHEKAYNYFLDEIVRTSTSGQAAETVARLGMFGGVAQAAMAAGASTYDAISGRMGVGANGSNITVADNTQGAALWLTPIYKNSDSDGFDAQGVNYGVDMDLYGVALGADYTLSNGVRFGAMFNVGSGDIDGQGAGSSVSNDFDYYGFAIYGGYAMGALNIVADLSYTVADNDLEGLTNIDKVSASLDSTNLSFGVTGAYEVDVNGMLVTPHVGLRYSNIDIDDYTVAGRDVIADYDADSLSIFSIPVGVTFAKEFTGNAWTVKPSFDVTLTGNFGDDETDGTVHWAGVENLSTNVSAEVLDSFTYGATLGVAAKTGNFSLGLGLNYTGSSNTDEFGLQANARFVF